MINKVLNVIAVATVIFTLIASSVIDVSAIVLSSREFEMYFYNRGVNISDYYGDGGEVIVPGEYKGRQVIQIDSRAFYYKRNITSVEISEGVVALGDYVFEKCYNLKRVIIADSVTSVGKRVFSRCNNLEEVIFGNGITSINNYTFLNCTKLKSLIVPENIVNITDEYLLQCPDLTIYGYSDTYAENYANQNNIPFVALDVALEQNSSSSSSSAQLNDSESLEQQESILESRPSQTSTESLEQQESILESRPSQTSTESNSAPKPIQKDTTNKSDNSSQPTKSNSYDIDTLSSSQSVTDNPSIDAITYVKENLLYIFAMIILVLMICIIITTTIVKKRFNHKK